MLHITYYILHITYYILHMHITYTYYRYILQMTYRWIPGHPGCWPARLALLSFQAPDAQNCIMCYILHILYVLHITHHTSYVTHHIHHHVSHITYYIILPFKPPDAQKNCPICMYVCIHACKHVSIHAYMHVNMYACMHIRTNISSYHSKQRVLKTAILHAVHAPYDTPCLACPIPYTMAYT